jgi:hypothetical protein
MLNWTLSLELGKEENMFKKNILFALLLSALFLPPFYGLSADETKPLEPSAKILFLHHSTGENIWNGGVEQWFNQFNKKNNTHYVIQETAFPNDPYDWANYPYDYWLLWIKNAGKGYQGQPTLETLSKAYQVIIWKHCFPGSAIEEDTGNPSVQSDVKSLENYKLQYAALKKKMKEFPQVRFIVWTLALELKGNIDEAQAKRAREFVNWVKNEWDEKGDNIYVWDFYAFESEGGLFLQKKYSAGDAHPNVAFAKKVASFFCKRIVDVIQGRGDTGSIMGQ